MQCWFCPFVSCRDLPCLFVGGLRQLLLSVCPVFFFLAGFLSSCCQSALSVFFLCNFWRASFAALDRVGEESDQYWEKMTEEKIKEFDSYRDTHPCIVADKERTIAVFVDGTGRG